LKALIGRGMFLEPGDHVGVEAERDLPLDGPVEQAAFGAGPVQDLDFSLTTLNPH